MATPVQQAAGTAQTGTTGALSVPWPASHAIGDLGFLVYEIAGTGETAMATPGGWTALFGNGLTYVDVASAAGSSLQVFYKFATSAAEANVATPTKLNHSLARIYTVRTAGLVHGFTVTLKTTASTTITYPALTTPQDNCLMVYIGTRPDDSAATTAFGTLTGGTGLTNLNDLGEAGTISGHGGGFVFGSATKATAGGTGTPTMSCPSVTNIAVSISIRPTVAGTVAATESGSDTFAGSNIIEAKIRQPRFNSNKPSASAVTGDLAVTEAGADTFAATGNTLFSTGTLAATETGADTFAASGTVLVQGSFAATEAGNDTFAASGTVLVQGTVAAVESATPDVFSSSGTVLVKGSLAGTETGADTFAASGTVGASLVTGSLSATETGSDTYVQTGSVLLQGVLAAMESGDDTVLVTGQIYVTGYFAGTESGNDTFFATSILSGKIAGRDHTQGTGRPEQMIDGRADKIQADRPSQISSGRSSKIQTSKRTR